MHSCPKTVFEENRLKMSSSWEIVVLADQSKSQGNKEDGDHGTLRKPKVCERYVEGWPAPWESFGIWE